MLPASVKDIMTTDVVSASAQTSLIDVAKILTKGAFNGVPIVTEDKTLIGIITEHDLISGQSGIHLPTLQALLGSLPVFGKDKKSFNDEMRAVTKMTAQDVMNKDPLTLPTTATYDEAVKAFQTHHAVNPIPVVDSTRKLIGIVSRFDLLKPLTT